MPTMEPRQADVRSGLTCILPSNREPCRARAELQHGQLEHGRNSMAHNCTGLMTVLQAWATSDRSSTVSCPRPSIGQIHNVGA